MHRRQYLKSMTAAAGLALVRPGSAAEGSGSFRSAICAYSFRREFEKKSITYADLIRMAAESGVDGVDMTSYWLADTNDETLYPLKKLAYRSAISIYSVGSRAKMAQPTPDLQAAEVETVRKWVDVAEKLGASHVRIFGGSVPKGASEDQAVNWAVETLKLSADVAGKKGITLGLEDDGGITTNADRTVEIVKKVDSQWVGINLDIGNFRDNAYAQIQMCAPFATNVHFKSEVTVDGRRQPPDVPRILKILGSSGYKGFLSLEYEAAENPRIAVPRIIAQLREAIRGA
jgi:L-ribulose-5-phosphate 3-epimerase